MAVLLKDAPFLAAFRHTIHRRPQTHLLAPPFIAPPSRCSAEDSPLVDAPLEPTLPKFTRLPFPSNPSIPSTSQPLPLPSSPRSPPSPSRRWRKSRRSFKPSSPSQTILGAIIGGAFAIATLKGSLAAYEHLVMHPPAHDLPLGLTSEVNQLLLMMVTWFGGLAVCMFGVSSLGLVLLSLKLLSSPMPPKQ